MNEHDNLAQELQVLIDKYGGLDVLRTLEQSEWGKAFREYEIDRIHGITKAIFAENRRQAYTDELIRVLANPNWKATS